MSEPHYEVVDADDRLVGDVKHKTVEQARALLDALVGAGTNRQLAIARVTERAVVTRSVTRLSLLAAG